MGSLLCVARGIGLCRRVGVGFGLCCEGDHGSAAVGGDCSWVMTGCAVGKVILGDTTTPVICLHGVCGALDGVTFCCIICSCRGPGVSLIFANLFASSASWKISLRHLWAWIVVLVMLGCM